MIWLSNVASVISLVSFEGGDSQIIFGKQKRNQVYIYKNRIIVRNYLYIQSYKQLFQIPFANKGQSVACKHDQILMNGARPDNQSNHQITITQNIYGPVSQTNCYRLLK